MARAQEGAISTPQLWAAGLNADAIAHRVTKGRLHPKWPKVYAVGRPELSRRGTWIEALLTCGPVSCLSDGSAVAYFGIGHEEHGIEVSVPAQVQLRRTGITIHRRRNLDPRHVLTRTRQVVNGYRVDFFWPDLGLVAD